MSCKSDTSKATSTNQTFNKDYTQPGDNFIVPLQVCKYQLDFKNTRNKYLKAHPQLLKHNSIKELLTKVMFGMSKLIILCECEKKKYTCLPSLLNPTKKELDFFDPNNLALIAPLLSQKPKEPKSLTF